MTSTGQSAAPQAKPMSNKVKYTVLGLFPLLLVTLFVGIFTYAMHEPAPRDLPVAVVGAGAEQSRGAAAELQKGAGDALDVRTASSVDAAKRLVADGEIAGAYVLPTAEGGDATLYVAGGGGSSLQQVTTQVFEGVAEEQHVGLQTEDLVPLPERDSMGTSSLYVTIGFTLAGFVFVIIAAAAAPELLRLRRLVPAAAGFAALIAVSVWLLTGPVIGAFEGHAAQVLGIGWLMTFSVSMVTALFARYLGPLAAVPAVLIFMFLGVPSSGGALAVHVEPPLFQFLHDVLPTPATLEAVRSVLYFDGQGVAGHLGVVALWGLAGIVLNLGAELAGRRKGKPAARSVALAH
ncbi:ABC transporter permease [Streptomyces sp. SID4956]|uniref:ABC transporter permease n=1 Tax=Streptomyces sp. SID4956 TaxID=2690290 RepID=UPI0013698490|nr:hypothetical protein [Streptomyces sp. SID4956]